jgi:ABC-type sugar transport system permease subunit
MENTAAVKPVKAKKNKRQRTELQRRARAGKLFIAPFIVGFICFYIQPLCISLYYCFCNVIPVSGGGMSDEFCGLANFEYLFNVETTYWQSLADTFLNMLQTTPVIIIFSLFLAVILNQKFRGRMIARAIFFMPVVVTSGLVIGFIRGDSFAQDVQTDSSSAIFQASGMMDILTAMNLPETLVDVFVSIVEKTFDTLWQCGVQILLFLAALQGVPPQLYEAAKIEGATGWETFWKVTFPSVTPIILVNVIYTIIDSITDSSNKLMSSINSTAFSALKYSLACLEAWIFFVLLLVLVGLIFLFARKKVFYQTNN